MRGSSISALLELGRWRNALIAAAGVLVGAWWAGGGAWPAVTLAALAAIALALAANSWNDAEDVEIDRTAHPRRPIPRGAVSVADARVFAGSMALLGTVLSAAAHVALGALALGVVVVARLYSDVFKRRGWAGNVAVAVIASLPFLWGAVTARRPLAGLMLVAIAAPLHFAREIAKDLEDASADAGVRRTLPHALGLDGARWTMVVALALFLLLLAPIVRELPLFAPSVAPAILLAGVGVRHSWRGERGGPALLKAAMLCAMAALLIARH